MWWAAFSLLPQIVDAAHAEEVCAYAKYPPLGTRGIGYSRAMSYGAYDAIDDAFFGSENRRTVCHAMIETRGSLRDVEAIAKLPTVDGLFIGPSDLSMARGRGSFKFSSADEEDFRTVAAERCWACRRRARRPLRSLRPKAPATSR